MKKALLLAIFLLSISSSYALPYYYGQVLIKDQPYVGIEITAGWVDNSGRFHEESIRTMNKDEATDKGNRELEGFYYFDRGTIDAKDGTNIVITMTGLPYGFIVPANSHMDSYKIPTVSFSYAGSGNIQREQNGSQEKSTERFNMTEGLVYVETDFPGFLNLSNSSVEIVPSKQESYDEKFPETKKTEEKISVVKDAFSIIIVLIIIFGSIAFCYILLKVGSGYISSKLLVLADPSRNALSRKALTKKIGTVMAQAKTSDYDALCMNALSEYTHSNANILYLMKGNAYKGFVPESKMLSMPLDKKMSDSEIDKDRIAIDSGLGIEEAFYMMQSRKANTLLVEDRERIVGAIGLFELQKALLPASKNPEKSLATVRDIMQPPIILEKEEKVIKAISLFSDGAKLIVISDKGKPIGVLSFKDCIRGLIKYGELLYSKNVNAIMSSNIVGINPEWNIFKANEYMLEKELKSYPVIIKDEVLGILTQERLSEELFYVIRDYASR